ncbi:MAG TPA: hypothetical protein VGI83_06960, partial [Gemmatimonadales bacterium]
MNELVARPCYVCGTGNNPLIAEEPVEHRFGKPLMPEGVYRFVRCRECSTLYVDSDVTDAYLASVYENETIDTAQDGAAMSEAVEHVQSLRLPEFRRHWAALKRRR